MFWTDERIARLRKLWRQGFTTPDIAAKLGNGCTKNMVVGKVRRLQLAYRARTGSARRPTLIAPTVKERPPQNQIRIRPRKPKPWKGISPAPKAHPLVNALIREMNAQRCSWVDMAKRSGVSVSTYGTWRTCYAPSLPLLEACFNVLGKTLQPVDAPELVG